MDEIKELDVKKNIGIRNRESHKGNYGKVLLVAGSLTMAGAACLAGHGAYRAGAGLVTCYVPEKLYPVLQVALPESICASRGLGKLDYHLYDSIVFGPGIGTQLENGKLLQEILSNYSGSLIIDADGLNCIVQYNLYPSILDTSARVVITPHPGEAKRLMGKTLIEDRKSFAISMAQTLGVTVVLKGADTLVTGILPDGKILTRQNPTGNPGMATAGSGDVLSGIIGAFLAKGMQPFDAATTGVYIHGAAGDLAAMELGETGMTATDIYKYLPFAIKNIIGR